MMHPKNGDIPDFKKHFFFALMLIALGIALSNTLDTRTPGTVLVAIGGLFFIIAMSKKKQADEEQY